MGTRSGNNSGAVVMPKRLQRRRRSGSGTAATAASKSSSNTTLRPPAYFSKVRQCLRSSRASKGRAGVSSSARLASCHCAGATADSGWAEACAGGCCLLPPGAFAAGRLRAATRACSASFAAVAFSDGVGTAASFGTWSNGSWPVRSRQFGSAAANIKLAHKARSPRRAARKSTVSPCTSQALTSMTWLGSESILATPAVSPFVTKVQSELCT
mmetsp:Transcript_6913/g.15514  ORF Transcript_6913/g.15514 Transcript_6913/m.15514 type:complete len:213 (-) Transcript_6913:404-1042(-)